MQTLYDFGLEVQNIREAADSIEVKGNKNASLVVYIYNKCNDIIQAINDLIEQQRNPPSGQNGEETIETEAKPEEEEGDVNGESDSGTTS